jgi:hypothetical protein
MIPSMMGVSARGALSRERDVREAYAAHSGELYGFAVRSLGDAPPVATVNPPARS